MYVLCISVSMHVCMYIYIYSHTYTSHHVIPQLITTKTFTKKTSICVNTYVITTILGAFCWTIIKTFCWTIIKTISGVISTLINICWKYYNPALCMYLCMYVCLNAPLLELSFLCHLHWHARVHNACAVAHNSSYNHTFLCDIALRLAPQWLSISS